MKPLVAKLIDAFRNGKRRVMSATEPGSLTATGKEGPVELPYRVGDALLADERDEVICGPFSLQGAVGLAESVLEGNERAITDPLTLPVLATALVAYSKAEPTAPDQAPTALEMAVTNG
ncbi:hypothetical protein [Mesorhizobium sp. Z1-4]|uniref:hypothetical protein n=1 Tax=Mesorhizobium sp. Z1-4 TaxID=2448478 RepID=UPI000FD870BC|nr:hypothetical protein [Mesorhizobium sp. Z1-4]